MAEFMEHVRVQIVEADLSLEMLLNAREAREKTTNDEDYWHYLQRQINEWREWQQALKKIYNKKPPVADSSMIRIDDSSCAPTKVTIWHKNRCLIIEKELLGELISKIEAVIA